MSLKDTDAEETKQQKIEVNAMIEEFNAYLAEIKAEKEAEIQAIKAEKAAEINKTLAENQVEIAQLKTKQVVDLEENKNLKDTIIKSNNTYKDVLSKQNKIIENQNIYITKLQNEIFDLKEKLTKTTTQTQQDLKASQKPKPEDRSFDDDGFGM